MRFVEFKIKNFKGIEDITVNLDNSPKANIYALIGLNESGKTTILEAINIFNADDKGLGALNLPGSKINDLNQLIPISKRDNFNGVISLEVTAKLDSEDIKKINKHTMDNTSFKRVKNVESIRYYTNYEYKNSKFQKIDSRWTGFHGQLKQSLDAQKEFIQIADGNYEKDNISLANFCYTLMPSILYFPNFLFDFPSRIYLEAKMKFSEKEKFYVELIQDILFSLDNDSNVQTHIIDRIKSGDKNDKRNLDSLLQKMGRRVTEVVFEAWNKVFKRDIKETRVKINCYLDDEKLSYIEFDIEGQDGIYQINERSLGFRWFFTFLLFTQFRPFRKDTPKNLIYLFDEPASNLHSYAQKQLLNSFENLTKNSKIIYTTHSHHLINPKWLESTYVVRNEGLHLDYEEGYNVKKTNITIESYREFVMNHPHNTAYFQPILDVLEYSPSNLEALPDCIFLEGKNDYYTLVYFQDVIFSEKDKVNLAPSTGSGNLDTLISLYIGWGKEFAILLDSDTEGKKQKARYINLFGMIVESRVFTLEDINSAWANLTMESFFSKDEALRFQQTSYPNSSTVNKGHFNRTMQEHLINARRFEFEEGTQKNIKHVLTFLKRKLEKG